MPADFDALTFDCYGTLIDWRSGVRAAASGLESLAGCDLVRLELDRQEEEKAVEAGPYRDYGEVLAESLRRAAVRQGLSITDGEGERFAASVGRWPAFPDSHDALLRLAEHYRLAILSNVETAALEESVALLDAPFAALVTAQELRSYKPARKHFDAGLERLGLTRDRVLHVCCSLFHDVRPAQELGIACAWINRDGLAKPADLSPRWIVPDLATLATELGC